MARKAREIPKARAVHYEAEGGKELTSKESREKTRRLTSLGGIGLQSDNLKGGRQDAALGSINRGKSVDSMLRHELPMRRRLYFSGL